MLSRDFNRNQMSNYNPDEYTFEALCLKNVGPKINTLAYVVGLVDSPTHKAGNPENARYDILYLLSEGEEEMRGPEDLMDWQGEVLPSNYFPQTPVLFVQRWSPIAAMLKQGFEPETLQWLGKAPHAVATGIWKPNTYVGAKSINDCKSDEKLFWSIMTETFNRAKDRGLFVNIISQVGWSYEEMIGSLPEWNTKKIAKSGRILWKRTWQR